MNTTSLFILAILCMGMAIYVGCLEHSKLSREFLDTIVEVLSILATFSFMGWLVMVL